MSKETMEAQPAFAEAKELAKKFGRDYFVNAHGYGANTYLLTETGRGRRCSARVTPEGEMSYEVQDFWAGALLERRMK